MTEIAALTARIDKLEHELAIQQDIHQIRRVQYTYGYFIDKSQYNEVVDLFADDGDVWFLGGIYRGKAGVRACTSSASRSSSPRDTTARAMAGCSITRSCRWSSTWQRTGTQPRYEADRRCRPACIRPPRAFSAPGGRAASTRTTTCAKTASGRSRRCVIFRSGTAASPKVGRRRRSISFPCPRCVSAGPPRTGCADRSAATAVARDRHRRLSLSASGHAQAHRAGQQPCARGVQDRNHEPRQRRSKIDDRLSGSDLAHQPPLLGARQGIQHRHLCAA